MTQTSLFKEFLANPRQTGSVIPSSRHLVKKMTQNVSIRDVVVELGSGTGCITAQIKKMGCNNIHVYENNLLFRNALKKFDFLSKENVNANAFDINKNHKANSIDLIISSLPLVNFSYKDRVDLLTKAFNILKPDGKFTMFTYKFSFPVSNEDLEKIGFIVNEKQIVWLNFPPATVISLQKK